MSRARRGALTPHVAFLVVVFGRREGPRSGALEVRGGLGRRGCVLLLAGFLTACGSGPASVALGNGAGGAPRLDVRGAAAAFDLGPVAPARPSQALAGPSDQDDPRSAPSPTLQPSATPSPGDTPSLEATPSLGPAPTGAPASNGPTPMPRSFVVLGDSLSAWAFPPGSSHASGAGAWPNLLAADDGDFTLAHNAAVPGNTTEQMLARFRRDVLAYHPDVLFLMGGTNDVCTHVAAGTTVRNIRAIVALAEANGIEVVLLTIPPINRIPTARLKRLRSINRSLIDLGKAEGITVVDVYAALALSNGRLPRAYIAADGLHLSERGEEVVAATVYARLMALAAPGNRPNAGWRPV